MMTWQMFDPKTISIIVWIALGKLVTVPMVTFIARSKHRPLFDIAIKPAQTRRELNSIWLLPSDALILVLLLSTQLFRPQPVTAANFLLTFGVMFLWGEWWMYWTHRWMHGSKLLWAWHRHHHQSRPSQALSSLSFSVGEKVIFYSLGWLVFISAASWIIPVSLWGVAGYYTFYFMVSPIAHSNSEAFGRVTEYAPRFMGQAVGSAQTHGYHHMNLTCNYGFMTVVFDRLFGTFSATAVRNEENMNKSGQHTFSDFYRFYLSQHRHPICRILHLFGVIFSISLLIFLLVERWWIAVPLFVLPGYALGWIGHFFFEHNRPASFKHPVKSFLADIRMAIDLIFGRESFRQEPPERQEASCPDRGAAGNTRS
jgi:hypothetical protein